MYKGGYFEISVRFPVCQLLYVAKEANAWHEKIQNGFALEIQNPK